MANRILRDWTDSETIDKLSWQGEVFFTRLCMKADDYGYYHANIKLLKSALFPLKDTMTLKDVEKLLSECVEAGLITLYESDNKKYLFIPKFGQRLRIMQSKFPPVPGDIMQPSVNNMPLEEKGKEENTKRTLMEAYIEDFPTSSHLEVMQSRTGHSKEAILKKFEDFKKVCELSYPTFDKFTSHFKNWYAKQETTHATSNRTTITFGKRK